MTSLVTARESCFSKLSSFSSFHPKLKKNSRLQVSHVSICPLTSVRSYASLSRRSTLGKNLEKWIDSLGHGRLNLQLQSFYSDSDDPESECFGTFAAAGGLQKGAIAVSVPRKAFMNLETALACKVVGPLVLKHNLTSWQALCLHLLWERHCGPLGFWSPYIAALPPHEGPAFWHPLLWPEDNRQKWLTGSPMLLELERRIAYCRADTEALLSTGINELTLPGPFQIKIVTEDSVKWAAAILLSRAFSLDLGLDKAGFDCERTLTLVPWADMLNHTSEAGEESCLIYNPKLQAATLRAHRNYFSGEQVFDSYGPRLSPSELFLDYGFVDSTNRNGSIQIPAAALGPLRGPLNTALLESVGLPIDGAVFSLTSEGADESVLAWTRAALASEKELKLIGWDVSILNSSSSQRRLEARAAMAMSHLTKPVNRQAERLVFQQLKSATANLLAGYPSSLSEKEEEEAVGMSKNCLSDKQVKSVSKQVRNVIEAEKLVLQNALASFEKRLSSLDRVSKKRL